MRRRALYQCDVRRARQGCSLGGCSARQHACGGRGSSRRRPARAAELRAVKEGQPIVGEIVSLAPRKENPRICDVRDSWTPPALQKGPAKVATAAYREGWDEVFGKSKASPSSSDAN